MTSNNRPASPWKVIEPLAEIRSPWVTVIAEKLQDDQGKIIDYWRVEKADSVIILTLHNQKFLLPQPIYRPGIGQTTLDFPGGRVPPEQTPLETVPFILQKELGIQPGDISEMTAINSEGWAINSSFSNQKLYGFVAKILPNFSVNSEKIGATYPITNQGIEALLKDLTCLQCRVILLEWKQQFTES